MSFTLKQFPSDRRGAQGERCICMVFCMCVDAKDDTLLTSNRLDDVGFMTLFSVKNTIYFRYPIVWDT